MTKRWFLLGALLGLALSACPGEADREVCGDGQDNDGNGLTDCDDPDCAGQDACVDNKFYGSCTRCKQACTVQSECVTSWTNERPIPYCTESKCTALEPFLQVRVELDTRASWSGLALSPQSGSTRFIKKTGTDGGVVTCATVAAAASNRTNSSAIEQSGAFVLQGVDVTRVTNPQLGQGLTYAFVNTQAGGDYLIWTELWGGAPDSNTRMPTGLRFGYGCYEAPAQVGGPLVPEDNCPSATNDGGTCRLFRLVMPAPEG